MARDVAKEWRMFEELMIATFGDHWRAPAMRHLELDGSRVATLGEG